MEWICHACHSFDLDWVEVAGRGRIYSWERSHHPVHPALKDRVPYVAVLVELPDAGNVRMVGNLLGDPMADVVIDSFEFLTDDTGVVRTRRGDVTGTSLGLEILLPYREIARRLDATGSSASLQRAIDHVSAHLKTTAVDDGGTPDPGDDRVVLRDRRLLPVFEALLAFAADTFELTPEQRDCWFDLLQTEADTVSHKLMAAMFASDMDLSHKNQLRHFILHIDNIADVAEDAADRLAIFALKRAI